MYILLSKILYDVTSSSSTSSMGIMRYCTVVDNRKDEIQIYILHIHHDLLYVDYLLNDTLITFFQITLNYIHVQPTIYVVLYKSFVQRTGILLKVALNTITIIMYIINVNYSASYGHLFLIGNLNHCLLVSNCNLLLFNLMFLFKFEKKIINKFFHISFMYLFAYLWYSVVNNRILFLVLVSVLIQSNFKSKGASVRMT